MLEIHSVDNPALFKHLEKQRKCLIRFNSVLKRSSETVKEAD